MRNVENPGDIEQNPDSSQPHIVGLSRNFQNFAQGGSRIRDPYIIVRVNQYLSENRDQAFFNINHMVDALRRRYREYRRRNWGQFKILVERAYAVISKKSGIPTNMVLEGSSSSDVEECNVTDDRPPVHSSNSQLVDLYQPAQLEAMAKHSTNPAELIHLSSDEDSQAAKQNHADNNPDNISLRLPEVTVTRRKKRWPPILSRRVEVANDSNSVTFADFAGNPAVLEEVCKLILHMKHPEAYETLGVSPPRGFLLHGPPGCGKTLLANAIAGELALPRVKVSGPELVAGVSGESEERIRQLFATAVEMAPCVVFIDEVDAITPNRQNAQKDMERRIVAQLLTSLDDLSTVENGNRVLVVGATNRPDSIDPALRRAGRFDREVCLGIPDAKAREQILKYFCDKMLLSEELDLKAIAEMTPGFVGADLLLLVREAAMITISRVFEEIRIEKAQKKLNKRKVPCGREKAEEPQAKKKDVKNTNGVDPEVVVENETSKSASSEEKKKEQSNDNEVVDMVLEDEKNDDGIDSEMDVVGTDSDADVIPPIDAPPTFLSSLLAWIRDKSSLSPQHLSRFCITQEDVSRALKTVQPSSKREGFATVPDVTWNDVGSLSAVREHLKMTILGPLKYQEQFEHLGLISPAGVLLCGPPGCGKTLLAKAVANEAGINFISVKGPELLNMYVGESERAVRQVFQRARSSVPCVIFFDELDALCPRRIDGDSGATMRVVNQLLTEMDGIGDRRGVFLMAASNRPDIIDPAILRPGRLDKTVYVGLPTAEDRADILRTITKNGSKPPLDKDVCLDKLVKDKALENFTGADLAALVREASMQALRETISSSKNIPISDLFVNDSHFQQALRNVRPSVSPEDLQRYEEMRKEFSEVPSQAKDS